MDILDLLTKAGIILGGFVALFGLLYLQAWSERKKDR